MTITADDITPPMAADRAQAIAQAFDLRALPPDFFTNPYPVYRALRADPLSDPMRAAGTQLPTAAPAGPGDQERRLRLDDAVVQ